MLVLLWYYIKQKQPMNYDKNKLKAKIENLNNRLHKKPKKI
jgi:hypothetical protein